MTSINNSSSEEEGEDSNHPRGIDISSSLKISKLSANYVTSRRTRQQESTINYKILGLALQSGLPWVKTSNVAVVPDTHDQGKGKFRIQITLFPRATDRKGMRKFHGSYLSKIKQRMIYFV